MVVSCSIRPALAYAESRRRQDAVDRAVRTDDASGVKGRGGRTSASR